MEYQNKISKIVFTWWKAFKPFLSLLFYFDLSKSIKKVLYYPSIIAEISGLSKIKLN